MKGSDSTDVGSPSENAPSRRERFDPGVPVSFTQRDDALLASPIRPCPTGRVSFPSKLPELRRAQSSRYDHGVLNPDKSPTIPL